jgi:hypothetical protein
MPRPAPIKNKVEVPKGYCRKCEKHLSLDKFHDSTNPMLDTNGKLSVCKSCSNDLYNIYFSIHNNMEISLQLVCEALDVCFNKQALKETKSHVEKLTSQGKNVEAIFGIYKSKLSSTGNAKAESFRYKDSDTFDEEKINKSRVTSVDLSDTDTDFELTELIVKHWGKGRESWEYEFLEEEIHNLKTDFECPDYGMEMIMKDICFINFEIEKIRQGLEKGDITKLIESRSKLMNDGNLKPVQSTGADKNEKLSLGVFIKKWENEKPIRQEIDDEMKRYIDTYMVGHLAKMEGLNNETVKKYDEAIKDYTINFSDIHSEEDDE